MNDTYVLAVAIEYYIDPSINRVVYAENDAKEILSALNLHNIGTENTYLLLSKEATKTRIESNLRSILGSATEDDQVLIYYAGHGFAENDHNYLTCADTVRGDLVKTSISIQTVFSKIRKSKCKKVIIFFDSCHSGFEIDESMRGILSDMTDDEFLAFFNDSEFHIAFASCQIDQYSYSSNTLKHGIWSYHIINALKGESPDVLERKRFITADSLQAYLSKEVPRTVRKTFTGSYTQTPRIFGNASKGFIIADLKTFLDKKKQKVEPKLAQLRKVFFSGEELGNIKSLSGFKKHHRLPDSINNATESFVKTIGHDEIAEYSDNLFKSLKKSFGYKRRDIKLDDDYEAVSIITKDFTVNIWISINPADCSECVINTEVTEIQNPISVNSSEFNEVFSDTFNSLTFQFDKSFDVEKLIDAIEDIDDEDVISVDYPGDLSSCTIEIAGVDNSLYITSSSFSIKSHKCVEPKSLIKSFNDAQVLLINTHELRMLPFKS
jgi:hypothetical protein